MSIRMPKKIKIIINVQNILKNVEKMIIVIKKNGMIVIIEYTVIEYTVEIKMM